MLVKGRRVARLLRRGLRQLVVLAGAVGIWTANAPLQAQPQPLSTERIVLESRVEALRQALRQAGDAVGEDQPVKAQWGNWNNWNNWRNSWNNWGNWLNR